MRTPLLVTVISAGKLSTATMRWDAGTPGPRTPGLWGFEASGFQGFGVFVLRSVYASRRLCFEASMPQGFRAGVLGKRRPLYECNGAIGCCTTNHLSAIHLSNYLGRMWWNALSLLCTFSTCILHFNWILRSGVYIYLCLAQLLFSLSTCENLNLKCIDLKQESWKLMRYINHLKIRRIKRPQR